MEADSPARLALGADAAERWARRRKEPLGDMWFWGRRENRDQHVWAVGEES